MTLPVISTLPATPARTQPAATFNTNANNFLGALPTFGTELNAFIAAMNPLAITVQSNANAAAASEVVTYNYTLSAAASALAAQTAAGSAEATVSALKIANSVNIHMLQYYQGF